MVTPRFLNPGDSVAIVSTARKITEEELAPAVRLIKKWGLKAVFGKTIGAVEDQFAGNDEIRANDFQNMLDNPEIKAIWCAKGGYGTVRIIDKLDFSHFKKNPKWIIGYSDVTVLHSHIHNLGVETLHAQTLLGLETKSKETAESIRKALFGEGYSISYEVNTYKVASGDTLQESANKNKFNRKGSAIGELVGGNLSILYSLCGSSSAIDTDGKILFIEDLDEYLYHLDRIMMNLKRNGMLQNLAGLIVGGMTEMKDNAIPFGRTSAEIVFDVIKEFEYPVCFDIPVGHIEDNRALILGRKVELNVQSSTINLRFSNMETANRLKS